ncbi:SwmB domain-containing protein [Leptothrix sp. BB-4]
MCGRSTHESAWPQKPKQSFGSWLDRISGTLPAPSTLSVSADGTAIAVTAVKISGTGVNLTLASAIRSGQVVTVSYTAPAADASLSNAALQDAAGTDAPGFSALKVTNTVAALPTVKINGVVASPASNGEYTASEGTRVTVSDSDSRLGSTSTKTVGANGGTGSATMSIHSMSAALYDVSYSSVTVGGLTTITFGNSSSPLLTIKLRWQ